MVNNCHTPYEEVSINKMELVLTVLIHHGTSRIPVRALELNNFLVLEANPSTPLQQKQVVDSGLRNFEIPQSSYPLVN